MSYLIEDGKSFESSFIVLRTWSETCKAFAPGAWKIGIATACLLSSNERKPYWEAASSTRATSPNRVTAPSGAVLKWYRQILAQWLNDLEHSLKVAKVNYLVMHRLYLLQPECFVHGLHSQFRSRWGYAALLLRVEPYAHRVVTRSK